MLCLSPLHPRHRPPRLEGIAEAADGMDQNGAAGVRFDLLAQAQDVDVHGAVGDGAVLAPDCVEQLLAAEDHSGAAHQKLQQPELRGGELQRRALQANLAAAGVQFQAAGLQHARGRCLVAKLELDARHQLAHEERLHYVIVGADLEAHDAVGLGGPRGQKDDGGGGEVRVLADAFADVEAVGIGQHDIEQDQVRAHLPAQLQRAFPGLQSGQGEALFLQVVFQEREEVGVVFDEENFFHEIHRHACLCYFSSGHVTKPLRGGEFGIKMLLSECGFVHLVHRDQRQQQRAEHADDRFEKNPAGQAGSSKR
ncbi:hypothetical protein SBA6_160018 [Candidatus Sulfopaludibacter sp. SbA6]|nr:hypothetical protein SBA6_160018 [Candidatus Sulfopaludibacter sp. SbA6]